MSDQEQHLSGEELLLAVDGELSAERAAVVEAHVACCAICGARMETMRDAATEMVRAYRDDLNPRLGSLEHSRATLEARMTAVGAENARPRWWAKALSGAILPRIAYAAAAIVIVALGVQLASHGRISGGSQQASADAGPLLPAPALTPGATRPIRADEACRRGPSDQMATIPMPVRKAVFHEYGMDRAAARNYEVDHLITPQLGGTDDIRNLWPEPYASTTWNAYVKDELEDRLRQMVCDGQLDLPTAQRDIATNWIAAYQKYFHTDKPLASVSSLVRNEKEERVAQD